MASATSPYDLFIVGTGSAATVAAGAVRAAGWRVAVADCRPFGGTCALRGCDPKKVLVGGAHAAEHVRRMRGKGIAGSVQINWPELIAFERTFTDPVPDQRARSYADDGIDTYRGRVKFVGPTSLAVEGQQFDARHVLIATGAEPIKLGIAGEEHLVTNEEFLAMQELPRRIAIVGGGYIAAEFSNIASVAGAEVTIFQRGDRMLEQFDPDLVGWLMEAFDAHGIDVRLGTRVEGVDKTAKGFVVHVSKSGRSETVEADLVLHAAGRAPALQELDLQAGGIEISDGRLCLNDYLQSTSNPAVYAAGDAAQVGPPLTPVSGRDGKVVAANLLEGNHVKPDYRGVPSVAFSLPPTAAVGMSEKAARESGRKFAVKCQKASGWYLARQEVQPVYGFKTLVEEETGALLGAHLVGPHADEVINLFALAIRHGLTADDLKSTMFSYPTGASGLAHML